MEAPLSEALTPNQVEEYRRLDSEIVSRLPGLRQAAKEVADIAREIRDRRLYKAEFDTWDDYCKARLHKTASAFRQLEWRRQQSNALDRAAGKLDRIETEMSARLDTQSDEEIAMVPPEGPPVSVAPDVAVLAARLAQSLNSLLKLPEFSHSLKFLAAVKQATRLAEMVQPELPAIAEGAPKAQKARANVDEIARFIDSNPQLKLTPEDGEWFFNKCEGCGWKNAGKPIVDWQATIRAWRIARVFPSQKAANGQPGAEPGKLTPAEMVLRTKELDAAEAKLKEIRNYYAPRPTWSPEDVKKFRDVRARRDELKTILGIKI